MPKKIPEGITSTEYDGIRTRLETFLGNIGASQVSMRLNESAEDDHNFSYFVGFVQNAVASQKREDAGIPDPGLFRFGDDVPSKEYRDTIRRTVEFRNNTAPDPFVIRNWTGTTASAPDRKKKAMGSRGIDIVTEVNYRKYIGIVVDGISVNGSTVRKCVGMLGVGFPDPSTAPASLDTQLKDFAQAPGNASPLVSYLRTTFVLGGPTVP